MKQSKAHKDFKERTQEIFNFAVLVTLSVPVLKQNIKLFNDKKILWNWSNELDFIHGIDHFRIGEYFKDCLEAYASKFGVENKQDFELEKISESIINIAKKKYIQHIVYEDGIIHDRLTYLYPKGVELVRSSTPTFARDKIVTIIKYLFSEPETFNIRELLKLVKNLRKEFDLCVPDKIDDISMQSVTVLSYFKAIFY